MATLKNTKINDTGFLRLPKGTEAQRPANPEVGMMRFNTDHSEVERYDSIRDFWISFNEPVPAVASSGGTVTEITENGKTYRVHTFLTDGTLDVTHKGEVRYLVIGGGGAGGNALGAGGGGAGGLLRGYMNLDQGSYPITIGDGGDIPSSSSPLPGQKGLSTEAFGLIAYGGGGGAGRYNSFNNSFPSDGGSGGGMNTGSTSNLRGTRAVGVDGQGNAGGMGPGDTSNNYPGAGGGGSAIPGQSASVSTSDTEQTENQPLIASGFAQQQPRNSGRGGDGGDGVFDDILGIGYYWAAGGGGGTYRDTGERYRSGTGGRGGGGGGAKNTDTRFGGFGGGDALNPGADGGFNRSTSFTGLDQSERGGDAGTNTGSGGGGSRHNDNIGGRGGSGIVIVRYRIG